MSCPSTEGKLVVPVPEVDYSYLQKDLFAEAQERLLWQFKNSPNICNILGAFFNEVQLLFDSIIDLMDKRQLAKATGDQLDTIGIIVGQDRLVIGAGEALFGFADDPTAYPFAELIDGKEVGGGRWLNLGEPETGVRELSDGEYRRFITAKILRNHLEFASACELQRIALLIISSAVRVQVVTVAPAVIAYFFDCPAGMTPDDIAIIISDITDIRADHQRIIGSGAGIGIGYYYQMTGDDVFGFADDPDPKTKGFSEIIPSNVMFGFSDSPDPKGWFRETGSTTGAGIYSDKANKDTSLDVTLDESNAGTWAEIIAQ